jgi:hypothetical protein
MSIRPRLTCQREGIATALDTDDGDTVHFELAFGVAEVFADVGALGQASGILQLLEADKDVGHHKIGLLLAEQGELLQPLEVTEQVDTEAVLSRREGEDSAIDLEMMMGVIVPDAKARQVRSFTKLICSDTMHSHSAHVLQYFSRRLLLAGHPLPRDGEHASMGTRLTLADTA